METQTARDCRPAGQERRIVNDSKGLNHQRPKPVGRFSRRRRGAAVSLAIFQVRVSMTKLAYAVPAAAVCLAAIAVSAQTAITIVLTGQSMIRSDLRTMKPAAVPAIK